METRKDRRRADIQNAILSAIALAGILAVTAVAPNTLQLLGRGKNRRFFYQTKTVLSRLKDKGYIRFTTDADGVHVELTEAGRRAAELDYHAATLKKVRPKWDKRWRMVLFDIPEKRKKDRDHLRRIVSEAGFVCLQGSVWVFPYDCEELIALIKIEKRFGDLVRYAIVEKLENDGTLRRHFKLPA